jgi:hypothetical protein
MPKVRVVTLVVARIMQLGKIKVIKYKGGGGLLLTSIATSPQTYHSGWKEGSHNYYLLLRVNRGDALDLFVCVVYVTPVGSKHKNESLFQNLVVDN